MKKIKIYPFKIESIKKWTNTDYGCLYNLSVVDVDWGAEPNIVDLHGWVNGTKTEDYREWRHLFDSKGFMEYKTREVPCLMAIVVDHGEFVQIESWRTRAPEHKNEKINQEG